jgi:hypothetical protein
MLNVAFSYRVCADAGVGHQFDKLVLREELGRIRLPPHHFYL